MTPFLLTFSVARGSAKQIFAVIDRSSRIDPIKKTGNELNVTNVNGKIEFKNICFSYPSRPDVQVDFLLMFLVIFFFKAIHCTLFKIIDCDRE